MPGAAVPTVSPQVEAAAVEELLGGMRWSTSHVDQVRLMAGHSRWVRGAGIRFVYLADGRARLITTAIDVAQCGRPGDDLLLQPGDFVLLPRGGDHELRAAPGNDARALTGVLTLDAAPFERVTELMPTVLFTCGFRAEEPAYGALLEMVDAEIAGARPGGSAVVNRLVDLVVAATLRAWLERGCASAHAWLTQLRDPHLGRALEAIHSQPGSPWTVEALARVASASRSQFAERFRSSVGESPARYVTRVRMRRAQDLLLAGRPVSEIAFMLGYDSDEGFRRAFQRHSGFAPTQWRSRARPGTAAASFADDALEERTAAPAPA